MIYLDHAATTPVPREVADAMYAVLTEQFGNPNMVQTAENIAKKLGITREECAAYAYRSQMLAAKGCSAEYIAQHPLTMHALVTMASIVERESSNGSESFDIASVFYNRLANPKEYPFLDSDATVHYAIGDYFGDIKKLTQNHLDTNSPYNTRGYQKGLPPGPICNPGIYSLYAALDPNETNFYFYVLNPKSGVHIFSRTYAEHQQRLKELGYT